MPGTQPAVPGDGQSGPRLNGIAFGRNHTELATAAFLTGCAGMNTVKISSVPNTVKVYHNGDYVGETPKSLPSKWGSFLWWSWGDAVNVRLEKEGYKTFERTIPFGDLVKRWYSGDCVPRESEFGYGSTYPYTFYLEAQE